MRFGLGFTRGLVLVFALVAIQSFCPVSSSEEPAAVTIPPPAASKWFVEFGPLWRAGGDVDFRIKSLPDLSPYRPPVPPSHHVGPADRIADREYDDGYVRMDYGTSVWDNDTWYWGYNSASQLMDSQLVFHGTTYSTGGQSLAPRDNFSLDLDDAFGGEATIGRSVFGCNCMTGSVVFGLGLSSFSGSTAFEDLGYMWSSQGGRITDTYNLLTDPSLLPAAPYCGTKEGPGYVIPNIPARREIGGGSSPLGQIYHSVRQDIDVDLWVLSLGLDVRGKGHKVSYIAGAGLTGNFIAADSELSWAATQNGAVLDSATYSDDDNAFEFGVYGEAGLLFELNQTLSLSLRARYDYLFDDAQVSFANTSAEIDVSGVSVLGGLGISF